MSGDRLPASASKVARPQRQASIKLLNLKLRWAVSVQKYKGHYLYVPDPDMDTRSTFPCKTFWNNTWAYVALVLVLVPFEIFPKILETLRFSQWKWYIAFSKMKYKIPVLNSVCMTIILHQCCASQCNSIYSMCSFCCLIRFSFCA